MCVVIEEEDEISLSMKHGGGERATNVDVDEFQEVGSRRGRRYQEWLMWMLGDNAGFTSGLRGVTVYINSSGSRGKEFGEITT